MALSSAWRKGLAIGCASLVILALVAAALIARSWPTLTGYYHRASTAFTALMHVASVLQTKYGGTARVNVKYQNGVPGATLSITLANPPFLEQIDPDGPGGREKVLEIAAAARDALPPDGEYDHYEVVLARGSGSIVNVSRTWVFRVEPGDLSQVRSMDRRKESR